MMTPSVRPSGLSIASAKHQAVVKAVHGDGVLRCQDATLHRIGSLVPASLGVEKLEDLTIYLVDGDARFDELRAAYPWATIVSPDGGKKRGRKPKQASENLEPPEDAESAPIAAEVEAETVEDPSNGGSETAV